MADRQYSMPDGNFINEKGTRQYSTPAAMAQETVVVPTAPADAGQYTKTAFMLVLLGL